MTISAVTFLGAGSSPEGGGNPTIELLTEGVTAGQLVLIFIAKKTNAVSDGTTSEITGITDTAGGNIWRSAGAFCNSEGGSSQGAYVDLWYSVLTNALPVGSAIGVQKMDDVACAALAYRTTIGTAGVGKTAPVTRQDDAGNPGSMSSSGLASLHRLHIRAIARFGVFPGGTYTATSGWTLLNATSVENIAAVGEFKIATSTGETSAPSIPGTSNSASILIGFNEAAIHDVTSAFSGVGSMSSAAGKLHSVTTLFGAVGSMASTRSPLTLNRTSAFSAAGSVTSLGQRNLISAVTVFAASGSMVSHSVPPLHTRSLIMLEGALKPASNLATWTERLQLYEVETGQGIDFVQDVESITITLRDIYTGENVMEGSLVDGIVNVPSEGIIEWMFPPEMMATLDPKSYDVGCLVKMSQETIQVLLGHVAVRRGL